MSERAPDAATGARPHAARNARWTAGIAGATALTMLGASFAAVPAYRVFCKLTGFAGTPLVAKTAPTKSLGQSAVVRFSADVAPGLDWSFAPEAPFVHIRLGETKTVQFHVRNDGDTPAAAVATFNVQPDLAGQYFNKLSCFCFDKTALAAGEARDLTVVFFVDPALAKDPDIDSLASLSLSYTFFASKIPATKTPVSK